MDYKRSVCLDGKAGTAWEMNAVTDYSALIDGAGINVCKLLLDDELTILWANDNFYISSGLVRMSIRHCFTISKHIIQGMVMSLPK